MTRNMDDSNAEQLLMKYLTGEQLDHFSDFSPSTSYSLDRPELSICGGFLDSLMATSECFAVKHSPKEQLCCSEGARVANIDYRAEIEKGEQWMFDDVEEVADPHKKSFFNTEYVCTADRETNAQERVGNRKFQRQGVVQFRNNAAVERTVGLINNIIVQNESEKKFKFLFKTQCHNKKARNKNSLLLNHWTLRGKKHCESESKNENIIDNGFVRVENKARFVKCAINTERKPCEEVVKKIGDLTPTLIPQCDEICITSERDRRQDIDSIRKDLRTSNGLIECAQKSNETPELEYNTILNHESMNDTTKELKMGGSERFLSHQEKATKQPKEVWTKDRKGCLGQRGISQTKEPMESLKPTEGINDSYQTFNETWRVSRPVVKFISKKFEKGSISNRYDQCHWTNKEDPRKITTEKYKIREERSTMVNNTAIRSGGKDLEKEQLNPQCYENRAIVNNRDHSQQIALPTIKALKSNVILINGVDIETEGTDCSGTKHLSQAKPTSFIDLSIASDDSDIVQDDETDKWLVEIIDDGDDYISLNSNSNLLKNPSTFDGKCADGELTQHGDLENKLTKRGLSFFRNKDEQTIDSLGDHNLVLINKGKAFQSIENDHSENRFVNENLHGNAKQHQSKMEDTSKSSNGALNRTGKSVACDKKKLINPGQGVQLRMNVKSRAEPEVPNEHCKQTRVISSAKSVSIRSTIKKEEKDTSKIKQEESTDGNLSHSTTSDAHLNDELSDELSKIVFYHPSKLQGANIAIGKGHLEFDLRTRENLPEQALLKMENAKLSQLLLEVEQARSATVRALLQVNTLLHTVQRDNTSLEGNLKTLNTEKKFLETELEQLKARCLKSDQENIDFIRSTKATEFESSLQVILSTWKKEKRELLNALSKSATKVKNAEIDAQNLRIQFAKVKEQLETSNSTFNKLLEHNMEASNRIENELVSLKDEKQNLLQQIKIRSETSEKVKGLEDEITRLKELLEETNDEKDDLNRKLSHLEKSSKVSKQECEELKEELDHSQDIVEKLAETENDLKERLDKETSEKKYLQDCLDETGQILLHLRNTEKKLRNEKDELEEDLEEEIQVNESLQTTLKTTIEEHKSLISRLEDMTKVHITVKESLHEASKKEKTLQQQLASLQKTNSILHFTLEKERDEKIDLQEMYDDHEVNMRRFKDERINEARELNIKLEALSESNAALLLKTETQTKENEELRLSLEQEEEDNDELRKRVTKLEKYKQSVEEELEMLRKQRDNTEIELAELKRKIEDLTKALKQEKKQYENLICTLEETEESLDKITRELSCSQDQVDLKEKDIEELKARLQEKNETIHEIEMKMEEEIAQKDQFMNRCKLLENELKEINKKCIEQKEEFDISQLFVKRLEREKAMLRKNLEEKTRDFETHKTKCTESIQKNKEELVGLQNQLLEKDRIAMKQKENFQDALDNTAADLKLLRDFLGDNVQDKALKDGKNLLRDVLRQEVGKVDIECLRKAHHRAEKEMLKDVSFLEGMLKVSKEEKKSVTVVRSPMSKIKLSEIKHLRDEMYDLRVELGHVRERLASACEDLNNLKSDNGRGQLNMNSHQSVAEIEGKLKMLDETIQRIENDHRYVIENNNSLINRSIARVSRENSLDELESSNDSSNEEELPRKDIVTASLTAENTKLKSIIESLRKRYGFEEDFSTYSEISQDYEEGLVEGPEDAAKSKVIKREDTSSYSNKAERNLPQKYLPPTSMRYPPRQSGTSNSRTKTTNFNGYRSNNVDSNSQCSDIDVVTSVQVTKKKGPSLFSAEMSLFQYDDSVAGDILRRKMEDKASKFDHQSDAASVQSAGPVRASTTVRIRRSGSLDDEENDEDSDASIGRFRRSKTLPKKFKSTSYRKV